MSSELIHISYIGKPKEDFRESDNDSNKCIILFVRKGPDNSASVFFFIKGFTLVFPIKDIMCHSTLFYSPHRGEIYTPHRSCLRCED
jgi:hypothetical protein